MKHVIIIACIATFSTAAVAGPAAYKNWKTEQEKWLVDGNKNEKSARPRNEHGFPLAVDWDSFEAANKEGSGGLRMALYAYCGAFWNGIDHYASKASSFEKYGNERDKPYVQAFKTIKREIKDGKCVYGKPKKRGQERKAHIKGKTLVFYMHENSSNVHETIPAELKRLLTLKK